MILNFKAILPAYANLYCIMGDNMVFEVCSFVLKTPKEIWLTTPISYFSIWASGIAPDFILCSTYRIFHPWGSVPSMSFLMVATRALFSLERCTLSRKRESWKSHGLFLVFSQRVSRILKASGFRSLSYKHWNNIKLNLLLQLWSGSSNSSNSL